MSELLKKEKPLHAYKMQLAFQALHIEILNAQKNPIKSASGFILSEENKPFLYACWHTVTGYDPYDIKIGLTEPERIFLRINLQSVNNKQTGVEVIGGKQTTTIQLYDKINLPRVPKWLQDRQHLPHTDLNNINIKVPFWHDAIKLPLPEDILLSKLQVIPDEQKWKNLVQIGDKVLIVGYPYGFSAAGIEQPTPVVLTRYIAATRMKGMRREVLLDGPGTEGMSGGPVFIEKNDKLYLFGIYTGNVFPDHMHKTNIRETALGRCCDLSLAFSDLPFVEIDSELSVAVTNPAPA